MSDIGGEKKDKIVFNNTADAKAADAESLNLAEEILPNLDKKTPIKRTPSKRLTFIERAQKESEELVKTMGGSLELGGRRTRSSTRGSPTKSAVDITPPSAKKARESPVTSAKATPSRARGRGRKLETNDVFAEKVENDQPEEPPTKQDNSTATPKKQDTVKPSPSKKAAASTPVQTTSTNNNDAEDSSVENAENSVVDAANTAAAAEEASLNASTEQNLKSSIVDKTDDEPDAKLETVTEEEHNHVEDKVEEIKKKADDPPKSDSPMDTDEQPDSESAKLLNIKKTKVPSEADVAAVAVLPATPEKTKLIEKKEPTPEPMEVDSSTTSNDATDTVDVPSIANAESSATVALNQPKTNNEGATKKNSIKDAAVEEVAPQKDTADDVIPLQTENIIKTLPPSEIVNNVADSATAVDIKSTKITESKADSQKSGNECCEPKIASPPITAAGDNAVSTPQYCN